MKTYSFWTFVYGIIIILCAIMELHYDGQMRMILSLIIGALGILLIGLSIAMLKRRKWVDYSCLAISITLFFLFGSFFYSYQEFFPALLAIVSGISSVMYLLKIFHINEIE